MDKIHKSPEFRYKEFFVAIVSKTLLKRPIIVHSAPLPQPPLTEAVLGPFSYGPARMARRSSNHFLETFTLLASVKIC